MSALRAIPTMMRIGFAEAVAYRAEMFVWVLSTTMPFVNLTLWSSIAAVSPVAGANKTWDSPRFVAYFLSVFIVRQLMASWACWEINWEVRSGTLAMRLLRPIHPYVSFLMQNLAALPMRFAVTLPVVAILVLGSSAQFLTRDPAMWGVWVLTLIGAWAITFFANVAIGALSLFMDSSIKIMDVWLVAFFVFSGYSFPLDVVGLKPLVAASEWLPFRLQIGLPVDVMTNVIDLPTALHLLALQWAWAGAFVVVSLLLWRAGVKRFQAFGG